MITLSKVSRAYESEAGQPVLALKEVDLTIAESDFVSVTGPSGCGKSTLLHLIGALDTPSTGTIEVAGIPLHKASEKEKTAYRREGVGIVFQFFNLMPTMTVEENILLPLSFQGASRSVATEAAEEALELVGLMERRGHFPHQLSGGEMQRTAIARALIHKPKVLIADEPTGNLDSTNAGRVMGLFSEIHDRKLTTMVIVTHSEEVAQVARKRIQMEDGRILRVIDQS